MADLIPAQNFIQKALLRKFRTKAVYKVKKSCVYRMRKNRFVVELDFKDTTRLVVECFSYFVFKSKSIM